MAPFIVGVMATMQFDKLVVQRVNSAVAVLADSSAPALSGAHQHVRTVSASMLMLFVVCHGDVLKVLH